MTRSSCVPHSGSGETRDVPDGVNLRHTHTEKQASSRRDSSSLGQKSRKCWFQRFPLKKTKSPSSRTIHVTTASAGSPSFTAGKKFCTRLTDLRGPPSIARWSSFEPCRVLTKERPTNYEGGMQAKSLPRPSPINTAKGHRPNRSPAV
jgi:hypothetical protein